MISFICFILAILLDIFTTQDNNTSIYTWYISLIIIGIGWHFGFSSATVWTTKATMSLPKLKSEIQAANECFMFLISGGFIFATGYIYEAGSSIADSSSSPPVYGWKILNYSLLLPAGIMGLILFWVFISPIDNERSAVRLEKEANKTH